MKNICLLFCAVVMCIPLAAIAQSPLPRNANNATQVIDVQRITAHVKFLADDLLDGRGIGTRGGELAIKYIEAQFEALGLAPGGEKGGYLQEIPVVGIKADSAMVLSFRHNGDRLDMKYYDEFIATPGMQVPKVSVENAELVFVGYGIDAPEYKWNDFKDVDVTGKVLLVMNNDPDTGDPNFFGGKTRLYYGRWDYKYEEAARKGAAGAIIIHTTPSAAYPWQVVQTSWSREQFEVPATNGPFIKMRAWLTEDATRRVLAMVHKDLEKLTKSAQSRKFRPVPLGIKVSIDIKSRLRNLTTANVIGLLPGEDPAKKDEVVVFTAHHDHLGIGKAVHGDSIYNGASDNASGVAAMIAIAQAFQRLDQKPRRSILFLAGAGEESGLLGSQYYAEHPTFSPGKIAAAFSLDGMNIWGRTRDVSIIGYGKTTIDSIVTDIAALQQRIVVPDQFPEHGSYYRSDQFSFAKIGVPAVMLDSGDDFIGKPKGWGEKQTLAWIATHYHQPSDEYSPSWDLSGAVEDAQLAFLVGLTIANKDPMPAWKPGDEFEKVRNRAEGK